MDGVTEVSISGVQLRFEEIKAPSRGFDKPPGPIPPAILSQFLLLVRGELFGALPSQARSSSFHRQDKKKPRLCMLALT